MKRRVILFIFIFIFIILGLENANTNVYAETLTTSNSISYISRYWDDETNTVKDSEKQCDVYEIVRTTSKNWLNGWYVVNNDVTISERIITTGTINLIICDGKTFTAKKGIHLEKGATLNIFSQAEGTGTAIITGISEAAGIGGSKLNNDGGEVNIFGGIINVTGGRLAAGIGGGNKGSSGDVTIYGGTITAKGGAGASGIGSGNAGASGTIFINDGVVSTIGNYPGFGVSGILIIAENLTVLGNDNEAPSDNFDKQKDYVSTRWKYMDIKQVHEHNWEYLLNANGDAITAICRNENCPETEGLNLTIHAQDSDYNGEYGGQPNNPYIDLNFNKAAFGTPTISYYKDGVKVDSCIDAGTYEAKVTVGGVTATKQFTIHKQDIAYALSPVENLKYDGTNQKLINTGIASGGEIQYKLEDGEYSSSIPSAVNAGNYNVYYKVIGDSNHNDVEESVVVVNIKKADSSITTAPTAISNLIYDGLSKELINTGIASGGEIQYKLEGGEYSSSIPTAVDAGNFNVYYKVIGDSNHNDVEENVVVVNIKKADSSITTAPTAISNLIYDGLSKELINPGIASGGEIQYKLGDGEYSSDIPSAVDAGNYNVLYKVFGTLNTDDSIEYGIHITINKATPTGYEKPSDLNAVYKDTLSSITLPSNWSWKNATELVGNDGNQEHVAVYTPSDSNYKAVEETLNVAVTAATPTGYEKPSDLYAVYGDTLSSITLPSNWSWKNAAELVGDVGEHEQLAIYTPTDSNYKAVEDTLIVTVSRTPEKPSDLNAVYGEALSSTNLTTGWAWYDPDELVGNVGKHEHVAIYTPNNPNYNYVMDYLEINVNQAIPTGYDIPDNLEAIYGDTLSSITLPSNWSWKNAAELVGNVGNQEHIAIYTPADSNYKAIEEMLFVSVLSSIPTDYKKPNDLGTFYGCTLSSVILPSNWSWKNPDELVGNVGEQEHIAIYTPTNPKYESVEEVLIVSVISASPVDYEKPNDLEAIYGEALSNIILPAGWSWEKPDELVGNVGNRTHTAIYTPTDPNYHFTIDELTIKVNQAIPTDYEIPNNLEATSGAQLSSITLPSNWSWKNAAEIIGNVGNQEHIAIYTPANKNYKEVEIILTISVKGANNGLPVGAIVGIAIGSTVIASVGIFSLIWFVIKKKSWADLLTIFKKKN